MAIKETLISISNQKINNIENVNGTFTVAFDDTKTGNLRYSISNVNLTTTGSSGTASGDSPGNLNTVFNAKGAVNLVDGGDHTGATIIPGSNGSFTVTFYDDTGATATTTDNIKPSYDKLTLTFTDSDLATNGYSTGKDVQISSWKEEFFTQNTEATAKQSVSENSANDHMLTAPCYVAGTLISTKQGEVSVENLVVGDEILTVSGQYMPVIWVGHGSFDCRKQLNPDHAYPVRIAKGAFGEDLPSRDLVVSPLHSLYIDGVMIPAYCLINNSTITQARIETFVTYYHVELSSHQAIYAEGLPAESYLDTTPENRHFFSEGLGDEKVVTLNKQYEPCPEGTEIWQHIWDTQGYAPLTQSGPILESVKAKLVLRAVDLSAKKELQAA